MPALALPLALPLPKPQLTLPLAAPALRLPLQLPLKAPRLALPLPLPLPKPKLPLPLKLPLAAPVLAFPFPLPLPTPTLPLPLPLPLPIDSADAETVRADRIAAARMMLFMTFSLVVVLNVSADTKMTETTQQGCRQKRRRNIGADRHGLSVFQLMPLSGKVEDIGKN